MYLGAGIILVYIYTHIRASLGGGRKYLYNSYCELSNPGSILMMCVRMYVSVTLRNVAVTSRRNVVNMIWIRTPSIYIIYIYTWRESTLNCV